MKLNPQKTKEMIICFCRNANHHGSIRNISIDGRMVDRVTEAKTLGVTVSADQRWNHHVRSITAKGKMLYMLCQLKRSGVNCSDLIRIVRPVLEYACPVWHTCLPRYLSDSIEVIQKRALKCIFPGGQTCLPRYLSDSIEVIQKRALKCVFQGYSYSEALRAANLPALDQRREDLCTSYVVKTKEPSRRLNRLLPPPRQLFYPIRRPPTHAVPITRTERFKNSLIPWRLRQ